MKVFKTAVSAIALCTALSGCGDFPKPQYPVSRPEPALPPQAALPPEPAPVAAAPEAASDIQARPTTGVQQQTLPPPPGARSAPSRPGARLEPRFEGGMVLLAAYRPGDDDAVVYPARARHHHAAAQPAPDASDTVTVQKGETLATIAKAHGATVEDLAKLNGLKSPYRLTAGDSLKVPGKAEASDAAPAKGKGAPAAKGSDKASAKTSDSDGDAATVKVGKGETLASIAKAHGTTVDALAKLNGLKSPYRLTAGDSLKLSGDAASDQAPAKGKGGKTDAPAKAEASSDDSETVVVGKGDTLASIAHATGVSTQDLARINHLKKPYHLKRGQTIETAEPSAPEAAPAKGGKGGKGRDQAADSADVTSGPTSTVTVRRHDTIQSLARQAKLSVEDLAKLNHLKKPYRLKPGQQIRLPDQPNDVLEREIASSAPKRATSVIAGRRDTLQSIARKEGLSVDELARLNGLKKPYRIKRGEKIKLPIRSDVPPSTPSQPSYATASTYEIQAGDTLYSVARHFGTDAKTLADLNGLDLGESLKPGRRIRLPGGAKDEAATRRPSREPADTRPAPPARAPAQPVPYGALPSNPQTPPAPDLAPPPPASTTTAPEPSAAAPTPYRPSAPAPESTTPADADVAAAGKGLFLWPVRGQTLQPFGPIAGGQRNDGLDIAAAQGEPVRAAAAGEVVYAGNSVPGFGNLVLIRHDGGWVTAYAHLANLDVKMRQMVSQGQQIGEVGMTGGAAQPELHFEVRYSPTAKDKARPIDPALVLPQ